MAFIEQCDIDSAAIEYWNVTAAGNETIPAEMLECIWVETRCRHPLNDSSIIRGAHVELYLTHVSNACLHFHFCSLNYVSQIRNYTTFKQWSHLVDALHCNGPIHRDTQRLRSWTERLTQENISPCSFTNRVQVSGKVSFCSKSVMMYRCINIMRKIFTTSRL
jgi:hypothetical protein